MKYLFQIIILLISVHLYAQNEEVNHAELFESMKVHAQNDELQDAISIGRIITGNFPEDYDAACYLALLYGRQQKFDSAFAMLFPVFESNSAYPDAHRARSNLYYWQNKWDSLLIATHDALELMPDDEELLYQRALAYYSLNNPVQAEEWVSKLLQVAPDNSRGQNLRKVIYSEKDSPEILARYTYDHFKQPYQRHWHMLTVGGLYPVDRGVISPYMNAGYLQDGGPSFIESTGYQLNVDAYLNPLEKFTLLAGYGISTGNYFPDHRAALHLWYQLPGAWSVSGGLRYFYFDSHYLFYAVGIEKYAGNYWFELKNYLFRKEYGLSASSYLTVRRYFTDQYHFLSATLGYGTSPDEPLTTIGDLQRLKAASFRLEYNWRLTPSIRASAAARYQYEEYRDQLYRHRVTAQLTAYIKLH